MIRKATYSDIAAIIALGCEAVASSELANPVMPDPDVARPTLQRMLRDPAVLVLVAENGGKEIVGFIIGAVDSHWYCKRWFVTDMGFWVREGHKTYALGLLRRLLKWAKAIPKVSEVLLATSIGQRNDEKAGELFTRNGFRRIGGMYRIAVGRPE